MLAITRVWRGYTYEEKRNIVIYIAGIMFYKLGIEFFNGSIVTLASKMFDSEGSHSRGIVLDGLLSDEDSNIVKPFTKLGGVQGLNQAAQCVGAILIAPLVKRWPTRTVLSAAILMFSLTAAILLIVDFGTGGKFKPNGTSSDDEPRFYGTWSPHLLFLFWTVAGICYGMVELIRRVIPVDIVGGHVNKLRSMDATVHIFYEIAGTGGAFASSSAISHWGANKSYLLTPIFFAFAGITWLFISSFPCKQAIEKEMEAAGLDVADCSKKSNYFVLVGRGFKAFGESVWVGARLIFTNRCFIWLVPSYAISLYLHRFLENTLAPAFAKRVLGTVQWSQIIVGGSNLGELLGAFSVLMLSDYVPTPLPWLRFDALALNLVWVLPALAHIATENVSWAWKVAGCIIPISMGWAAGDISLAAYIQSVLSESALYNVSALSSVMGFLYTTYIVLYAVLSVGLAYVIDQDWQSHMTENIIRSSWLRTIGGIQFTVCCVIIFGSTFIPKGAFSLNPKALGTITTEESDSEGNRYGIDHIIVPKEM